MKIRQAFNPYMPSWEYLVAILRKGPFGTAVLF